MPHLHHLLQNRKSSIRTLVVGAGTFGAQMVSQLCRIPNAGGVVFCDLVPEKARAALLRAGIPAAQIGFAETAESANRLLDAGKKVVMDNAFEAVLARLDAVCDVTGEPFFGGELAFRAICAGKHMVAVNIESDAVFGAALLRHARQNGVVYSQADGDQPALILALLRWCACLGLHVNAAGKWTSLTPPAERLTQGKRSDVAYHDGSKNQVELCCVANMSGLLPDRRGLHTPSLPLEEIPNGFCSIREGGIFTRDGVVDAVNCHTPDGIPHTPGHLGGGVFAVADCPNPYFAEAITSKHVLHSRDGKRALFYRPYHLVGIEAPMSILRAVLQNEASAAPLPAPVAEVIAIAKRDLTAGTALDGIGGQCLRGEAELFAAAQKDRLLPLCMAQDVTLRQDIPEGTPITYDMVDLHWRPVIRRLRAEQELSV